MSECRTTADCRCFHCALVFAEGERAGREEALMDGSVALLVAQARAQAFASALEAVRIALVGEIPEHLLDKATAAIRERAGSTAPAPDDE